ncbi:MAG: DegT/DnrJ/EryC1/StrS aminotransferase family protein, partial [Planctomycetota bacterium]
MGAMTQAPLPRWADVRRAPRGSVRSDDELTAPWRRAGDVAGLLSRSSWSIALVAEWRRRLAPERPVTVWLPAFFCNSALVVLRRTGARLVFYPITDALEPEMSAFATLAAEAPPDVVMVVHYFGRPTPTSALHDLCTRHKAWLLEDAAHVLGPVAGVGVQGDFVLYSPHKHLPIPDGAVLVARPGGPSKLGEGLAVFGEPSTWPAGLATLQRELGSGVRGVERRARVWLAKRVAQKLGARSAAAAPFAEPLTTEDHADLPEPSCSTMSRRLLGTQAKGLGARARERHQVLWDEVLPRLGVDLRPTERATRRAWTPYLSAYSSDSAERAYTELGRRGFPVTTWPDLPPEVKADRQRHEHAWRLRHSRVYLPVHASLGAAAIARCAGAVAGPSAPSVTLRWDSVSSEQWHGWLAAAGQSNLLQDWAYGLAKAEETGWAVRRLVFMRADGTPVAIAQLFERRIARVATLRRLNRGPVFVGAPTGDERLAVWRAVAGLGGLVRREVLAVRSEE